MPWIPLPFPLPFPPHYLQCLPPPSFTLWRFSVLLFYLVTLAWHFSLYVMHACIIYHVLAKLFSLFTLVGFDFLTAHMPFPATSIPHSPSPLYVPITCSSLYTCLEEVLTSAHSMPFPSPAAFLSLPSPLLPLYTQTLPGSPFCPSLLHSPTYPHLCIPTPSTFLPATPVSHAHTILHTHTCLYTTPTTTHFPLYTYVSPPIHTADCSISLLSPCKIMSSLGDAFRWGSGRERRGRTGRAWVFLYISLLSSLGRQGRLYLPSFLPFSR